MFSFSLELLVGVRCLDLILQRGSGHPNPMDMLKVCGQSTSIIVSLFLQQDDQRCAQIQVKCSHMSVY